MKSLFGFLFSILVVYAASSCQKDREIIYRDYMSYGHNLLTLIDSINPDLHYSFGAELGEDAELKVVLTNLSVDTSGVNGTAGGNGPMWMFSISNDWSIGNYTNNTQEFIANKKGKVDLDMFFVGEGEGKVQVDYYENSDQLSHSRYWYW